MSIEFSDTAAFPGQRVDLNPFTVICGLHGSGKSSLLGYIAECLRRDTMHPDNPPFYGVGSKRYASDRPSLRGGCQVSLRRGTQAIDYAIDLGSPRDEDERTPPEITASGKEIYPEVLNPHMLSSEINMFFQDFKFSKLDDKAIGPPEPQNRKDLDALRDILGIAYDEVTYTPVLTDNYAPVWPYIKARRGNDWIDSHAMSHGELCVHFIRWALKEASDGIVLLDEPEANIAPRGHAALLDELARLARVAKAQVVLTTHAPAFLSRVPLEWVRMCVRPSLTPVVVTPSRASDLRDTLGVEHPLKSILVVEDGVAEYTLRMILAAHQFPAMAETEILTAGSWNDVLTTAKALSNSRRVTSIAILDGDQQDKVSDAPLTLSLPGKEPPEKVFFKHAATQPSEMAQELECSLASMNVYLAEMLGLEHHRWLTVLSRRTGQDWKYCLRVIFKIWHSDPVHQEECEVLTKRIEDALLRPASDSESSKPSFTAPH
ncbi:AAA family ATPase [Streptomyces glebosus]|uniref:AAA family ATPase n=1 Tax=Streptomyces glebosus TaxID=249580 RepID=UPI00167DFDF1|nr:AAA family ATPase [Streptomyces glebosus]